MKRFSLVALAGLTLAGFLPTAGEAGPYNDHTIYGIHFYGEGAENTIKNGKPMYSLEMLYTQRWKTADKQAERNKYQAIKDKGFTLIMRIDYDINNTVPNYGDWNGRYDFAVQAGDIAAWMDDIVDYYIIGNEMTTAPNEHVRNAWWYAACYNGYDSNSAYDKIKLNDGNATVLLGALTGWPGGNELIGDQNNTDWLRDVQNYVDQAGNEPQIDGYALHAYSGREYFEDNIWSDTEDPRFSDIAGFGGFIEFMKPIAERHGPDIPVMITETNTYWMPIGEESDMTYRENWMKEAFQAVDEWNAKADLKVGALIWYTYSHFDFPANRDIYGNAIMRTDNWRLNAARNDFAWVTANKNMVTGYPGGTLRFQAENYTNSAEWKYDTGWQTLDYNDTTHDNQGGLYRFGNEWQPRPDVGWNDTYDGFMIGWMEQGEWLRYATVAGGREYRFRVRSARGVGGTGQVSLAVDNVASNVASCSIPYSGGWNTYQLRDGGTFWLPYGFHHLYLKADTGATNVDWFELIPVGGPPNQTVTLQAEDYSSAYDTTPGNTGGAYRGGDVDIENCSEGGYNVGWIDAWEHLRWVNVNSPNGGVYDIEVRMASPHGSRAFNVEANGADASGLRWWGPTGGWQSWTTVNAGSCTLNPGNNEIKIVFHNGSQNINWVRLVPR